MKHKFDDLIDDQLLWLPLPMQGLFVALFDEGGAIGLSSDCTCPAILLLNDRLHYSSFVDCLNHPAHRTKTEPLFMNC